MTIEPNWRGALKKKKKEKYQPILRCNCEQCREHIAMVANYQRLEQMGCSTAPEGETHLIKNADGSCPICEGELSI